jgi:hypothetical protein
VWSYPEYTQGRPRVILTDIAALFVADEAEKQAVLRGEPRLRRLPLPRRLTKASRRQDAETDSD